MKILIIGFPDHLTDSDIIKAISSTVDRLKITDVDIQAKLFKDIEIAPKDKVVREEESKFIRAVKGVFKVAPKEAATDSIAFRSWFYSRVLDNTITRPILEIISFGPSNSNEGIFLTRCTIPRLPEYAKVALSMLQ